MLKMIQCKNLYAKYLGSDENILNGISFSINKPCFILLCGPNGSGKSTLLRLLRGLNKHYHIKTSGELKILGDDILNHVPEDLSSKTGMVFQRPKTQLFETSVDDEIKITMALNGWSWDKTTKRVSEISNELSISHLLQLNPHEISSGEQQKTVLAANLSIKPKVLLLDEPASYLDPISRKSLFNKLKILSQKGVLIIMSSHRIDSDIKYADHVMVLNNGKLAVEGSPNKIMFRKQMETIIPSRGPLKVSKVLWTNNYINTKIFNYENLNIIKTPKHIKNHKYQKAVKNSIITFKNVSYKYPSKKYGLKEVDIRIPTNKTTLIVGANGSGKTTLIKICLKILNPQKGEIQILGKNLKLKTMDLSDIIGFVPQDPMEILFNNTVEEELSYSLITSKSEKYSSFINQLLKQWGFLKLFQQQPENLSVGKQRLLTIILALISEPKILLLDEPELALDSKSLDIFTSLLNRLHDKKTIVISTHDIDTFLPIADYIIILNNSTIVANGPPSQILNKNNCNEANIQMPTLYNYWKDFEKVESWDNIAKIINSLYEKEK